MLRSTQPYHADILKAQTAASEDVVQLQMNRRAGRRTPIVAPFRSPMLCTGLAKTGEITNASMGHRCINIKERT